MPTDSATETARPISRVLIANRGEIAVRVIRACRELGIGTVAVCSDADQNALHAQLADQSVIIGTAEPRDSYLKIDRILEVAAATDCDAVHPGYGFLAENAGFARQCREAGLKFIGPSPEVIEQMGEKTAARALMEKAGVPVVPGSLLPKPDANGEYPAAELKKTGEAVGYPLMVKAAFGGGGKGMRMVSDAADLREACQAAAREAKAAFGDGTIYVEKFITEPRHVELQIFGDSHGNYVHLCERECSIQRRHQKIIEEAPAAVMTAELREKMGAAAVAAAAAVSYEGAGTVEFLLSQDGHFYFLEMNTRLQVEHPVTELATGTDLVRTQIRVAEGRPLPWTQDEIATRGHAIECRIYAEDPEQDFRPSLGKLLVVCEPSGPGIRVDSGVRQGDEVTMFYDPMIAKLCVHGDTRAAAIDRAVAALKSYAVLGVRTNIEYLIAILQNPTFAAGALHTGFIAEQMPDWHSGRDEDADLAVAVTAVAEYATNPRGLMSPGTNGRESVPTPWDTLGNFRLNGMG
ncbi:MAG: acetyl-CoA carboxylase biotin carboxylase subunit [Candidatus Krumholzibacteriia bacterium]|jgi:acetyl-CoA carboxylase biotin carboxylase subunit